MGLIIYYLSKSLHTSHRLPEHASRSPSETREPDVLDPRGRRRRFALSSWKLLCFSQGLLGPPLPPAGCGQSGLVRFCQPSTPTPISCRGIHMGHVWVHLDKRAMILVSVSLACERLIPPPASDAHLHSLPPWRRRHKSSPSELDDIRPSDFEFWISAGERARGCRPRAAVARMEDLVRQQLTN